MNKNDLISAVSEQAGITKADASKAVEAVFDSISGALAAASTDEGDCGVTVAGTVGAGGVLRRHASQPPASAAPSPAVISSARRA